MTQVIDFIGGEYRNRTGVHGFAIRCVTTPPTRRSGVPSKRLIGRRQAIIGWDFAVIPRAPVADFLSDRR